MSQSDKSDSSLKRLRTLRGKAKHRVAVRRPRVKKSDRCKSWAREVEEWK